MAANLFGFETELGLQDLRLIDSVCEQFEQAWRRGESPLAEPLLSDAPESIRPRLAAELRQLEEELSGTSVSQSMTPVSTLPANWVESFNRIGYELLGELGRGGMGVVYKARHRYMDRIVAVKILPTLNLSDQALLRFRREVRAVAQLSHRNIVVAHDAGEIDGVPYLVMEYIPGETLAEHVRRRGPLSLGEAVDYFVQAAAGLSYAHVRGVVHRDVKPTNVLIAADVEGRPLVKVLDLGLARLLTASTMPDDGFAPVNAPSEFEAHGLTTTEQLLGSCHYMAPEQAEAPHSADARADVYGLGCLLHFLLIGSPPFNDVPPSQVVQKHRAAPRPRLRSSRTDVPEAFEATFQRLLAANPMDRPQDATEVVRVMQPWIQRPSSGPRPTTRKWFRAAPAVAIMLLACGSLILGMYLAGSATIDMKQPNEPLPARVPFTSQEAAKHQAAWAKHLNVSIDEVNSIGMTFRLIPPGEFRMGSGKEEQDWTIQRTGEDEYTKTMVVSETPRHLEIIDRAFYLSTGEVTRGQFRAFVHATRYLTTAEKNGRGGTGLVRSQWERSLQFHWDGPWVRQDLLTDDHPVGNISWHDAKAFCEWLSAKEGRHYDLPTEVQWEFACRAGSEAPWSHIELAERNQLRNHIWHDQPTEVGPKKAGEFPSNAFGIFHMHGNMLEWCRDHWSSNAYAFRERNETPQIENRGLDLRVIRGGAYDNPHREVRSARRSGYGAHQVFALDGFRVICEARSLRPASKSNSDLSTIARLADVPTFVHTYSSIGDCGYGFHRCDRKSALKRRIEFLK